MCSNHAHDSKRTVAQHAKRTTSHNTLFVHVEALDIGSCPGSPIQACRPTHCGTDIESAPGRLRTCLTDHRVWSKTKSRDADGLNKLF